MPLEISEICFAYGRGTNRRFVLDNLSFRLNDREFLAILGPSGCGKSTLLRIVAGFIAPTSGAVLKNGVALNGSGSDRAMVMQQNALFPWLDALKNVACPLKIKGVSLEERTRVAAAWLETIGMSKFAHLYPAQLSVGMQQRIALARLFVGDAEILLMDEPFGAMDSLTRMHSQQLLLKIWERELRAVLFVTHDVEEALLLADRILVLGPAPCGIIHEYSVPWPRPRNLIQAFGEEFIAERKKLLVQIGALRA